MEPALAPAHLPRILLVEDHADTRHYLQLYLQMKGYVVDLAATVEEAREAFERERPDVLLSDIGLPDGSGWDLLRELQARRPIYAIAMSGFGGGADRITSEAAGFHHHIRKPFDPLELDRALEQRPADL